MNWKKFFNTIFKGIAWYTGIWIFCLIMNDPYIPPRFDMGDILVGVFIISLALINGTK